MLMMYAKSHMNRDIGENAMETLMFKYTGVDIQGYKHSYIKVEI
jgi:hypothetical protein